MSRIVTSPTPAPASTSEDAIRERGAREYFLHRGEYRNPFHLNSNEYNAYERGWMQSLKRNEGKLVSLREENPTPPKPPSSATDYNAYAELKGRSRPRS